MNSGKESKALKARWLNDLFLSQQGDVAQLFADQAPFREIDLRGISIGGKQSTKGFSQYKFVGVTITDCELDWSNFETSFHNSRIESTRCRNTVFEYCDFSGSNFSDSDFSFGKFKSPTFKDGRIERCEFVGASFSGSRILAYGGRRMVFENCDFSQCSFKNIYFLAAQFRDCRFEETVFSKCALTGLKFESCDISPAHFIACDLKSVTIDGVSIDQEQSGSSQDKARILMEKLGIDVDPK